MTWTVVKGVYKRGIVEPLEEISGREGLEVLVLFPEQAGLGKEKGIWQRMKENIAAEMPDLLNMTDAERREEFERLSELIASNMPYNTLEEFEQSMRGDEYGLVRY